jgi:hypothetical protein
MAVSGCQSLTPQNSDPLEVPVGEGIDIESHQEAICDKSQLAPLTGHSWNRLQDCLVQIQVFSDLLRSAA